MLADSGTWEKACSLQPFLSLRQTLTQGYRVGERMKNQNTSRLDFAKINPAEIVFLTHHVQISRRKAVRLTTKPERFLAAVIEARQKAADKADELKRIEAEAAEYEIIRALARIERDNQEFVCKSCKNSVTFGSTKLVMEKDRAERFCEYCAEKREKYFAEQKAKADQRAAEKAAEEWLLEKPAPAVTKIIKLPTPKTESNNNHATFNAPKGIEVVEAMLAEAKAAEVTPEVVVKAKAKRKPKAAKADTTAPVVKKPRAKKRAPEMTATA